MLSTCYLFMSFIFLFISSSMYFPKLPFNWTMRWTRARTAGQASKHIKRLFGINYRTWHSNCVRENIGRGRRQRWLSTPPPQFLLPNMPQIISLAVYGLGRRFCLCYFRTPQSEFLVLKQYWYLIRAKPISYLNRLPRAIYTYDENWETGQSLLWVESILYMYILYIYVCM